MVVALILAGMAVLASVVVLAMGQGGELAPAQPDRPTLPRSGGAVVGVRAATWTPPRTLWGYHTGVTDAALRDLAHALTERDTQVAVLRRQVDELRHRLETGGASDEPLPWEEPRSGPWWGGTPEPLWEIADEPAGRPASESVVPSAEEPR